MLLRNRVRPAARRTYTRAVRPSIPTLLLACLALPAAAVQAEEQAVLGAVKCTCNDDLPSYESLRCPTKPPADPSPCERINKGLNCRIYRLPKGLGEGYRDNGMDSFLLRHSIGWKVQCSLCAETHVSRGEVRDDHREAFDLAKQMQRIGGRRTEVAMSANFVVISNLRGLKIACRGGGARLARRHELLHLYLQRAEMARRDFVEVFGQPSHQRSAIVLVKRDSVRSKFAQAFFGNGRVTVLRGGGSKTTAGGFAGNGTAIADRSDDDLHFRMRHMIGHLLISCYNGVQPHRKYCPHWLDKGCAHWLAKLHPRAEDFATFCQHEGTTSTVSGSGSRWRKKAARIARRGSQRDPVEAMFQASTQGQMDFNMHVRAWSWYDVFTAEERGPFVEFIQRLRRAEEPRAAAKAAWGQPPEIVDDRWRERVTGKRRDVSATKKEKEELTTLKGATSRELHAIGRETDTHLLASRIRGLEKAKNVATARLLTSLADSRDSHRVREVIALVLERTDDEEVLEYLLDDGYGRAGPIGRATLCRVFGTRKLDDARPLLREALSDSFWLVQANAARSLAQLGDEESMSKIAQIAATERVGKLRCAAMDALGLFGKEAERTIPQWERNLMDARWQVKVATCDAMRAIGSTKALDMLIGRLDSEGGRVHDEIRTSIKDLTGMERDWTTQQWMKWWNHTKKFQDAERPGKSSKRRRGGRSASRRRTAAAPWRARARKRSRPTTASASTRAPSATCSTSPPR